MKFISALIATGAVALTAAGVRAEEAAKLALGADAQKDLMVTVYNNNYGLVREVREVTLPKGLVEMEFQGVAESIDATSVAFKSLTAPDGVAILEQNYRYDLLNPQTLLDKFVGKKVVYRNYLYGNPQNPFETREGTLLSTNGGAIVRFGDSIEINPPGTPRLDNLPPDLLAKPTLLWLLRNEAAEKQRIETSYLTNGMNWTADYVATANADDTRLDITGWVTLVNNSGGAYKNALLKLVAGDVRRVQPPMPMAPAMEARAAGMAKAMRAEDAFAEKSFFEYHLYTLGRRTTLGNNETKQMTLLEGTGIPVTKRYVLENPNVQYRGGGWEQKQKLAVMLEFENKKENGLGIPLPKGRTRVYKADTDASLQFIGEDVIDHTPKDEKVRLKMGEAFDIVAESLITNENILGPRSVEKSVKVTVRNHKEGDIVATIIEHADNEWRITAKSHEFTKRDAQTYEFALPVKAGGETVMTYTIRINW